MPRPSRPALVAATVAVAALALTACGSSVGHRLVVARGDTQSPRGVTLFAVDPDHPSRTGDPVSGGVSSGGQIRVVEDGAVRTDNVASAWAGKALVAAGLGSDTKVTITKLGERPRTVSRAGEARVTVLGRGVLVETLEGCSLTSVDGTTRKFGAGRCAVSEDGRWLANWPLGGGRLRVFDLRRGSVRSVDNLRVSQNVVAIGRDNLVAAEVAVGTGARIVLVDAATGKVVGRSPVAQAIAGLDPKYHGAPGAAVVVRTATGAELWFMSADGSTTRVDRGALLVPVSTRGAVTYLRYDARFQRGAVVRRDDDGSLTTVLRGVVGAGPAGPERIVMTRERRGATEFFTTGARGGEVRRLISVAAPAPTSTGATSAVVDSFVTDGARAWVVLSSGQAQSLVQLDLKGDRSAAVLRNWQLVRLNALDTDGTALVTGARTLTPGPDGSPVGGQLLTVRPGERTAEPRLALRTAAGALLHEGVIYLASGSPAEGQVVSLERGEPTTKVLYRDVQLAGSLWPTFGGGTEATLVTPGLVLQQAQQGGGGGG